jgi:lysophospholipase L1-like esterase
VSNFWVKNDETMLFIGDSITDCGRRDEHAPLGNGYVNLFSELATARFPDRRVRYVNMGIGGDTVAGLQERWQTDVLDRQPDRLSIKIGINDLSRHLRGDDGDAGPAGFEEAYDRILGNTARELGCPVVLITPFYVSADRTGGSSESEVLRRLTEYIGIVEAMSRKHGTRFLNVHDVFQEQLRFRGPSEFAPEPVHPFQAGHMVIANALMDLLAS